MKVNQKHNLLMLLFFVGPSLFAIIGISTEKDWLGFFGFLLAIAIALKIISLKCKNCNKPVYVAKIYPGNKWPKYRFWVADKCLICGEKY